MWSSGHQPPTLTLLEIGDLSTDRFRGIFRLGYQGDAWIEVRCRVQANPLSHNPHLDSSSTLPMSTPLLASQPLLVPMTLRLSSLNLRAILILVVSKSKGITLVFKNDPLQNVDVSSTFDSIEVIRGYLQQEIEGQLKELFREDLPGIIHRLSQKWFGGAGMSGKVEMPYRHETVKIDPSDPHTPLPRGDLRPGDPNQRNDYFEAGEGNESLAPDDSISVSPSRRLRTSQIKRRVPSTSSAHESPTSYTTFPEIENYDPTYGLRPEGVPSHSGYGAFGRLWDTPHNRKNRGLNSLMSLAEEITFMEADEADPDDIDIDLDDDESDLVDSDDGARSVNAVDASPSLRAAMGTRGRTGGRSLVQRGPGSSVGIAAIRGGIMTGDDDGWSRSITGALPATRPRIYHVQSQIRAPSEAGIQRPFLATPSSPSGTTKAITNGQVGRASSVRSSAGGSSVGLGMARSILNGQGGNTSRRMWPDRMMPPQFRTMSASPSAHSATPRPDLARSHSRSESVPAPMSFARPTRGQSAMQNVVSRSSAASTHGNQSVDRLNPLPRIRPMSMQAYPAHPIVTPPKNRRPSGPHQPSLSGSPPGANSFGAMNAARYNNIVLPLNDSVSQLASLSHSNHTLSPYARSHEHIAVRSAPYLSRANSLIGTHPASSAGLSMTQAALGQSSVPNSTFDNNKVKARRRRMFRLGHNAEAEDSPAIYTQADETHSPNISPDGVSGPPDQREKVVRRRPPIEARHSYGFPSDGV
jgi:distribution and morphology protein 34